MADILLTDSEIAALIPDGLKQPGSIASRLNADGFARARVISGRVVLEREHYLAVCRGQFGSDRGHEVNRPRIRSLQS